MENLIKDYEIAIWESAKNTDYKAFLNLVANDAVMICGGYRCLGKEYAEYIKDFDIKSYEILKFQVIFETEDLAQVHYVIKTTVKEGCNSDLEGAFHVTSTWKRINEKWQLIFNMDSKVGD